MTGTSPLYGDIGDTLAAAADNRFGPNVHAYWPLRDPLPPREAEHANLRLAQALGADRACYDVARILRPPGTWNHKRRPPSPVAALRLYTGVSFDASEVVERAREIDREPVERRWTDQAARQPSGDPLLRLAPAVYVADLLGVTARAAGKVHRPFHSDERPSLHVYPTAARGWCQRAVRKLRSFLADLAPAAAGCPIAT